MFLVFPPPPSPPSCFLLIFDQSRAKIGKHCLQSDAEQFWLPRGDTKQAQKDSLNWKAGGFKAGWYCAWAFASFQDASVFSLACFELANWRVCTSVLGPSPPNYDYCFHGMCFGALTPSKQAEFARNLPLYCIQLPPAGSTQDSGLRLNGNTSGGSASTYKGQAPFVDIKAIILPPCKLSSEDDNCL